MKREVTIWIYGFFRNREAVYIGQTVNPKKRESFHRGATSSLHRQALDGCQFRILRKAEHSQAARIESQIIVAYKKRGQASCNIRERSGPSALNMGYCLLWMERQKYFGSLAHASRVLDCPYYLLSVKCRSAKGAPFMITSGVTLQEQRTLL